MLAFDCLDLTTILSFCTGIRVKGETIVALKFSCLPVCK